MSAIFAEPMTLAANQLGGSYTTTAPLVNMLNNTRGSVWRSESATDFITVPVAGAPVDFVALWGTNLTASHSVRVRLCADASGSGAVYDTTVAGSENVIAVLPQIYNAAFVRIDITRTGLAFVQAMRLIVSKRLECEGVSQLAETTYDDESVGYSGPNYDYYDDYPAKLSWKAAVEGIDVDDFYFTWQPFLKSVKQSRAFVFVPFYPSSYFADQAVLGTMSSSPKQTWITGVDVKLELSIVSV